jgi:hypothetical protein
VIGLNILAQTTGSRSSTNFFRTDNRSGFDAESKDDEERSEIKESRPADQDPDGHWGPALDGLQLSLRFKKQAYTNGENIIAIVLIRNVSSNSIDYDAMYTSAYPSPINISASKDQERLKIKKPPDWHGGSLRRTQLPPQSQDKYEVNLNQFFELVKHTIFPRDRDILISSTGCISEIRTAFKLTKSFLGRLPSPSQIPREANVKGAG